MANYSQIIESKDGNLIPLCRLQNAQEIALHSKYNPLREAEGFAANVDESCLFFVVLGIAGGYHIQKILEKCADAKILAVESDEKSLDFLFQIPLVKELSQNKRVIFASLANIEEKLLASYKPALHGNLTILSLRQWENAFPEEADTARQKINAGIKLLAADYSVQSHFGKIWQKNILTNLSLAEKTKSFAEIKEKADTSKTAAIIAAGPSLDEGIKELKENLQKYFIIATDTAFSALTKRGIKSDAVVSIDGQMVSHQHYMESLFSDTLYCFDLCANSSSVRKVLGCTKNVILAETGHPLAQYASMFQGKRNFIHLEAGSGTVTIAAASLAQELGFSNDRITFFGADFSYIGGKPYASGTYLESQFHSKSGRFNSADKLYTSLMYRTETKKLSESKITTDILEAYKNSLEDFMKREPAQSANQPAASRFSLKDFKSQYCKELKSCFRSRYDYDENSFALTTLLPLCAKLGKNSVFLAYLKTLIYTEKV